MKKLEEMTLQEKIGQLIIVGFHSTYYDQHICELVEKYRAGNIILFTRNFTDASQLKTLTTSLYNHIVKENDIIIFESTVYPTMTEDYCIPMIEAKTKLQAGKDFFYGYSPERVNVGDSKHTLTKTIKIVAGCDEQTKKKIANIYKTIPGLKVETVASIKIAEAAKLMENTQRDILIAFANEYSDFCTQIGVDINDVIASAATKWNFSQVYPGLV